MANENIIKKDMVTELKDMQEENNQSHLEPVNVIIGRFQMLTNGHLAMAKELEKENGLPSVYIYIRSKSGKNSVFSDKLTNNYMEDAVKGQKNMRDTWSMSASFIPVIIMETQRRGYNPVLLGAGPDRTKTYEAMVKKMKNVTLHSDFKVHGFKERLEGGISATKVRNAILDDDIKTFKKNTPKEIHSYYPLLKSELEKTVVMETVSELVSQYDTKLVESILNEYSCNLESDYFIVDSILEYHKKDLNKMELTNEYKAIHENSDSLLETLRGLDCRNVDIDIPTNGKSFKTIVPVYENGTHVDNRTVSVYNNDNVFELSTFTDRYQKGLRESVELNEGDLGLSRKKFVTDIAGALKYFKNDPTLKDELYKVIKEFFGEHGVKVFEHTAKMNDESLTKANKRVFETVLAYKNNLINESDLSEQEIIVCKTLSKVSNTKLNKFKDSLVEMVGENGDYLGKIDSAVVLMLKTNKPIVWEAFKSNMLRCDYIKKEFRPFLIMQGLSDYQIDIFIENLLFVKFQHYKNYYLGNVGRSYIIK